jgi:D-alanine-D-alanine ligase-like ATP-grasp enzyme
MPVTRRPVRELLLIYEPEEACRSRLKAEGFAEKHALEISSYLAQSTDLAMEFDAIGEACRRRDLSFRPLALEEAAHVLNKADPETTLVWTLTDGIAYFRGGAAPVLARLNGLRTIGSDDTLFALCQDKFRSGAVLKAFGLPVPDAGLARDGIWATTPPKATQGYFVKPNRLGAKIGIWEDSRCRSTDEALALSRRIFAAYRDDAIVQAYVPGRNVRASFLAVRPDAGPEALGVYFVDSGADFQTMTDSMGLYGETGTAAKVVGLYAEPRLAAVEETLPEAARKIRSVAEILMKGLGLRDVFSIDFRGGEDGSVHLIEFEVAPGLPCFDFRAYCRDCWRMSLAEAMAESAAGRF